VVLFRSLGERLAQLGVEPNGLDASRSRADRRTSAASADRFVDVVTGLGLIGELLDELVGDRLAAGGPAMGLLRSNYTP